MSKIDTIQQDVLLPLFMVQMPEKSLARRGYNSKDWEYVVENMAQIKIHESNLLNSFISLDVYRQILLMGTRLFGAEEQIKHYIEDIQAHHSGPIGTAINTAPTLNEALFLLERFHRVTLPMLQLETKKVHNKIILEFHLLHSLGEAQELHMELVLLATRKLLVSVNSDASNMKITFSHKQEHPHELYQQLCGTCPSFANKTSSLVLSECWLDTPNKESSPLLYQQALKECEILETNKNSNTTTLQQVQNILMGTDYSLNRSTLNLVAEKLCMSARTLSRKLKQEGANFKDLENKVRMEKVKHALKETKLPIKKICYNSGFNDLSSFSRAFRKHTNLTPTEYRSQFCHA